MKITTTITTTATRMTMTVRSQKLIYRPLQHPNKKRTQQEETTAMTYNKQQRRRTQQVNDCNAKKQNQQT